MAERRPNRTLGPGHDDFWAWCDKGELRLPRCGGCNHLAWPIVEACDHCGAKAFAFERMSGRGKIASWCTFEHDYYRGILKIPYETILVELEEGVLFISNPVDLTWRDITVDMPVSLSFLDCEDDAGPFRLPVFQKGVAVRP